MKLNIIIAVGTKESIYVLDLKKIYINYGETKHSCQNIEKKMYFKIKQNMEYLNKYYSYLKKGF